MFLIMMKKTDTINKNHNEQKETITNGSKGEVNYFPRQNYHSQQHMQLRLYQKQNMRSTTMTTRLGMICTRKILTYDKKCVPNALSGNSAFIDKGNLRLEKRFIKN